MTDFRIKANYSGSPLIFTMESKVSEKKNMYLINTNHFNVSLMERKLNFLNSRIIYIISCDFWTFDRRDQIKKEMTESGRDLRITMRNLIIRAHSMGFLKDDAAQN
jgi:hypothetical protein